MYDLNLIYKTLNITTITQIITIPNFTPPVSFQASNFITITLSQIFFIYIKKRDTFHYFNYDLKLQTINYHKQRTQLIIHTSVLFRKKNSI